MISASLLDPAVARLLTLLGTDDLEVERLIRIGATTPREVTVEEALGRLGLSRSAWSHRFGASGNPGVRHLLTWGRILAAMLAWEPQPSGRKRGGKGKPCAVMSLEVVARRQGWSYGHVLGRAMLRYSGMNPREWHASGSGVEGLCGALVRTWREGVRAGRVAA